MKKVLKKTYPPNFSVDINNKIPFPAELDDLTRLHYITTLQSNYYIRICGMSTIVFADAI